MLDPVTLAVLKGRLEQIADEMDATLYRSAFNPIIAEAHDACHGIYDAASGATLVQLGVRAVIAPSFSGLYFRNAFNVGLLLLTCADSQRIAEGERLALAPREGYIECADGNRLVCESVPGFLLDMVEAGGLLNLLKLRHPKSNGASSC